MDSIVTHPEQEKSKLGDYTTDWGMVRRELSVYTSVVWLTFVVFSMIANFVGGLLPIGILCTALLVVVMFFASVVFSVVLLLVSWVIHLIATRVWGATIAFHDAIRQSRNTWIIFTILLWIQLLVDNRGLSTLMDVGLLVGFPATMVFVIGRIYRMGVIESALSLVVSLVVSFVGSSVLIAGTSAIVVQLLHWVF
jgi:hypothetical protein